MDETEEQNIFEDNVRHIARLLWPSAQYDGAAMYSQQERDGVFSTDDATHLLECTVSRKKDKALKDVSKLASLAREIRRSNWTKAVQCWFVTKHEPTADQRAVSGNAGYPIVTLSFDQFRARIVDARQYLDLRMKLPFGSVRNPSTGKTDDNSEYIPLSLSHSDGAATSIDAIAESLLEGKQIALLGDYGAGKSMTMRELFRKLRIELLTNRSTQFPVLLNLRDHHGQTDPVEALERHSRSIGYPFPAHLVRAWRAGLVVLMLDGFDEMGTAAWTRQISMLRDIRRRSMQLVRTFVKDSPQNVGVIVSGRQHFFDNPMQMREGLGLANSASLVRLNDFSEDQAREFLVKNGWTNTIPSWLPSRPLLLAYLVSKGLLAETFSIEGSLSPAAGWHSLLTRVCDREAEIESGIDGQAVRRIIESLATKAREKVDGLGPLTASDIVDAFTRVCGFAPDEHAMVLVQRLPGLGIYRTEDDSRTFVDSDLADAARAGEVVDFSRSPFATREWSVSKWVCSLSSLGVDVARHRCNMDGLTAGHISSAIEQASAAGEGTLGTDLLRVLEASGDSYTGKKVFLRNAVVENLVFDGDSGDFSNIELQSAVIATLSLNNETRTDRLPIFRDCYIGKVEGRVGLSDLPEDRFPGSEIEDFSESALTTSSLLDTQLPLGSRVMLTMLKKIFLQAGSGRRESSLRRGLDGSAQLLVQPLISILKSQGIISPTRQGGKVIWHPVRGQAERVRRILAAPNASTDSLLELAALAE